MKQTLNHQYVINHLFELSTSRDYLIAYSGGLDSSVLLYLMYKASLQYSCINISAIHVNHGISAKSHEWEDFCQSRCHALGVPYRSCTIDIMHFKGQSLEASARKYRYSLLASHIKNNHVLLTAHHQDDQCETLLLQMLRGAGLSGIASMPEIQNFSNGYLARPLLNTDREAIKRYAINKNLDWIEDESNLDTGLDRNYIRHNVIPIIKERWPSASKTIARTAKHAGESIYLVNTLARQDYVKAKIVGADTLSVSALRQFCYSRQKNLLRQWIREHRKSLPSTIILQRILRESIQSGVDRNPKITWSNVEVRRYRNRLYIFNELPISDSHKILDLDQACESLPLGVLSCDYSIGTGISKELLQGRIISIRFRSGGESISPYKSSYPHRVKKLMSEHGVPPWLRDLMPLVYVDNELVAIPGICVDKNWMTTANQTSLNLTWRLPVEMEFQNLPFTQETV